MDLPPSVTYSCSVWTGVSDPVAQHACALLWARLLLYVSADGRGCCASRGDQGPAEVQQPHSDDDVSNVNKTVEL